MVRDGAWRKTPIWPRRAWFGLMVTALFVTTTRTVKYPPGFVVCGRADPSIARLRDARETASRSANDLKQFTLARLSFESGDGGGARTARQKRAHGCHAGGAATVA